MIRKLQMDKWDRNASAFIMLDLKPFSDRTSIATGICETVSILPNPRFVTPGWHVFARSALSIYDLDALVCTICIWNNRYISTCVIWNDIIIDYIVTFWHYTTCWISLQSLINGYPLQWEFGDETMLHLASLQSFFKDDLKN